MNHIGEVINRYRNQVKMKREDMANGICSEKYVYLIEKGDRTPSSEILKAFSERLGVDLFDYYEYLDCVDPLSVKKYIEEFRLYRAKLDSEQLKESTQKATQLHDFNEPPYSFEIEINEFYYATYFKEDYLKTIDQIETFLDKIESKYSRSEYFANALVLLSSCYIFIGDLESSYQASMRVSDLLDSKYKTRYYEMTMMNIRINIMTVSYHLNKFDTVLEHGSEIIQYKFHTSSHDRVYYAYFYTSFVYYKLNKIDNAVNNFKKGIYLSLTEDLTNDIKFITMQDVFIELLKDERLNKELVKEFSDKYKIKL